ncbi:VOC family protein [Aurantiacibacter zhengii]|uniref:VOC family protein n=2 Tax=Aurantiacibacter zhengii TaxID=2307003 RepID=A0A418NVE3_9SPHN|nr:VOC family protein [Aurantiacibacter zhengii]
MLNHAAWVTHNVEATANFYTEIMGMDLVSTVFDDQIPSTGDAFAYFHIFFRMRDGSTLAFFEAPGLPARSEVSHPAYDIFDHIALQAEDRDEVDRWAKWLTENDIPFVGPTDHSGLIYSIYFQDPNDIRLEITTPLDPHWNNHRDKAEVDLKAWCDAKKDADEKGEDVGEALLALIRSRRHARSVL